MRDPSLTNSYGYYQYYVPVIPDYDANVLRVPQILADNYTNREEDIRRSREVVYVKNAPDLGNVQGTGAVGTGTSFLVGNQPPTMVDPIIEAPLTNVDVVEAAKVAEVVGLPLPPSLTVRQFGDAYVIPSEDDKHAALVFGNLTLPGPNQNGGINPVINSQGDRLFDVTGPNNSDNPFAGPTSNPNLSLSPAGPQLPSTGLPVVQQPVEEKKDSGFAWLTILGILVSVLK